MFRRETHRRVCAILGYLRAEELASWSVLFGGGTRIVLDLDEFRESDDIDFLCSDPQGYADLRFAAATGGYAALFSGEGLERLQFPREMKVDQYGIRFRVDLDSMPVRLELIREARIALDPGVRPEWSPVACLSVADCFAEKLLANSDRWADRQILSRDLIDLAALRLRIGPIPGDAWRKVDGAYKSAAARDLGKALDLFLRDEAHRTRSFQGLKIEDASPILEGAALLLRDLEGVSASRPTE